MRGAASREASSMRSRALGSIKSLWPINLLSLFLTLPCFTHRRDAGDPNSEPFYDPFNLFGKTPEAREKMAERELKNARLAMIGLASFVAGHFIPGSVPCLPPGF